MEDTHKAIYLTDHEDQKFTLPCQIYNSLDYITLEIMSCRHNPAATISNQHAINATTQSQSRLSTDDTCQIEKIASPLPSLSTSQSKSSRFKHFPTHIIANIASYILDYFPHRHPGESDLRNLFDLFNMNYRPNLHTIIEADISNCHYPPSHDIIYPVMDKLYRTKLPNYTELQSYKKLHLASLHLGPRTLTSMINHGTMLDIPKGTIDGMKKFHCDCYQCMIHRTKLMNRGPGHNTSNIPPFTILHFDFQFFGTTSIRGFTSSLAIVCGSTSYPFNFPTRSKALPIDILHYIL